MASRFPPSIKDTPRYHKTKHIAILIWNHSTSYQPRFHFDVYGTIGYIFGNDTKKIADYLIKLEEVSKPFHVTVECPVDISEKNTLVLTMKSLKDILKKRDSNVWICADDWCNTLEDIEDFVNASAAHMIQIKTPDLGGLNNTIAAAIYCKKNGVKAFLGGTCNGTDQSTRVTVHVALAVKADLIYNKPGMGVDEGYMIVYNEMKRTLALLKMKESHNSILRPKCRKSKHIEEERSLRKSRTY